jgi:hypothetical protein
MHRTKAEYLRQRYSEKNCFSAITMVEANQMIVGTPCIVDIHLPNVHKHKDKHELKVHDVRPKRARGLPYPKRMDTPIIKDRNISVNAKELYDMSIVEANTVLQTTKSAAEAMFVFNTNAHHNDFYIYTLYTNNVYFTGKKPLMYDNGISYEIKHLSDIHNSEDIENFGETIYNKLKKNRYINYTFTGVTTSNKKHVLDDINTIFDNLKEVYPKHSTFFLYTPKNIRSLLDVVSISFYRIEDVIAIFDHKRTHGMCVEIFLTNSTYDHKQIVMENATATYRFLFAKSRENIFTVDGEIIYRECYAPTETSLHKIFNVINKEVPNDRKLRKNSQ